jgi:hypothetical protein
MNLSTPQSIAQWQAWANNGSCCPNYWKGGQPYANPTSAVEVESRRIDNEKFIDIENHDTIGTLIYKC